MATRPDGVPTCFELATLEDSARFCGVDEVSVEALAGAMEAVGGCDALTSLLWHAYYQLTTDRLNVPTAQWPSRLAGLDEQSGMLYLLAALASVPAMRRAYERLGIPEDVVGQTCREIACFAANHQAFFHGLPGLCAGQFSWLAHYLDARLFRLGRFEYMLKPCARGEVACRHRDGNLILLAADGLWYDADGLQASEPVDEVACRRSELTIDDREIRGLPISPRGFVLREPIVLPRSEWAIVHQKGTWHLDMHIPSGGGMTPDRCRESMASAFAFFSERFGECAPQTMTCRSWIFNPQFEELLPAGNLSQLIQRMYLFPIARHDQAGMFFVFGPNFEDLASLPRETSLQRAMISVLEGGGRLRQAGMFVHRDDLDAAFAEKTYRRMFQQVTGERADP